MNASQQLELVRVHDAAGLALVRIRGGDEGTTKWIPWPPSAGDASSSPSSSAKEPSVELRKADFAPNTHFQTAASADGHSPQNVLVFLHGRGDNEAPFAKLGAQMALPQTAVISLRAPVELPFGLGNTWYNDLDDDFEVIPPHVPHATRSERLTIAEQFVWDFLQVLHSVYGWKYERMFLFGFSQGACVAYHLLMTLPASVRLGGVVLVAGGCIIGPHSTEYAASLDAETPVLGMWGSNDPVYPTALALQTEQLFAERYPKAKTLFTKYIASNKSHEMIRTRDEMLQVMTFFSSHLYLKNMALEARSDLIEIKY
ncbi:putative hydrolase, partial [Globisporangium splendens]